MKHRLKNGHIIGNKNAEGSQLRIVCNQGYHTHADLITCSNGIWSAAEDCIPSKNVLVLL